jgi:hypothetical protein
MSDPVETKALATIGEPSASIIQVASKLPPRDLVKVENSIRIAIKSNPALAEVCIYCKPVGKEDGLQQFAVGPSIRFTELGQQCFERLWINGYSDNDGKRVRASVMCFDLATLNITFGTHSKSIIGRGGNRYSDSMVEVTTNAALSIARRNALLQQMRPQLESCMEEAKQSAIRKWSPELDHVKAYNALYEDFKKRWGTSPKQLKEVCEKEENKDDQIVLIIGIRNYLIDNHDKYRDVFGCDPVKNSKQSSQQTEKQKYNTLKLQIETAGKAEAMAEIVAEYQGKVSKGEAEFSDDDYKTLNSEIEKLLMETNK